MKRLRSVFYGWWIVAAAFGLSAYVGGAYWFGFSVFFNPIQSEFGWSRAETSAAFSLASLEGGIEGPIIGPLVDRFGPRRLMFFGVILVGLGFIVLGNIQSLWALYLVYVVLLALGSNTALGIAPTAAVAQWFIRKVSLAFALLSAGFSAGGGVMVPLLSRLIAEVGWRAAAIFIGITIWLIGTPLTLVVRHKPEQYGYLPDGDPPQAAPQIAPAGISSHPEEATLTFGEVNFTLAEALRARAWWLLALAFSTRALALNSVVVHQVPLLVDRGFDPQAAANLLGLVAFMGLPGRLVFGYLGDRYSKRPLLVLTFFLMSLAVLILSAANSEWQVVIFAVCFGMSWGAVPLMFALRAEYFGREAFGAIGGFMAAVMAMGTVSGPIFSGWIFDVTGSYVGALILIFVATLAGAGLAFLATPPPPPARARATGVG